MGKADIGLVGLAVMGQNLVLNMADNGYRVAVYNRTPDKTRDFVNEAGSSQIIPAFTPKELVDSLERPRKIMLMVKAGAAVDAVIDQFEPLLEPGDLIIDGGNSFFRDTVRREERLKEKGLMFMGVGISGGEEGARYGPSIMPGGTPKAWNLVGQILTDVSAEAEDGTPCCTFIGPDGAGHFVKMVHNGIEYGDMQLITEAYFLMKNLLKIDNQEMAEIFSQWNNEELESYLVEITADILRVQDPVDGGPLVEKILDTAGQKGTGSWTSQESLALGVSAPTIAEAVFARAISAIKSERVAAAKVLPGPTVRFEGDAVKLVADIRTALYAAKICSYAQGFALLRRASEEYEWDLDLGAIAQIWRNGCIIRAQFLNRITEAYQRNPDLANLLLDDYFRDIIVRSQEGWRNVVSQSISKGIPVPGFSSSLAYYDSYRLERLPANLLQAQRDYFGAHTYERLDMPGVFHTEWAALANEDDDDAITKG